MILRHSSPILGFVLSALVLFYVAKALLTSCLHDSRQTRDQRLYGAYSRPAPPQASSDGIDVSSTFNNTLGFENILVVGLPKRSDRRDGIVLAAALSNMTIEFVDGVRAEDIIDKSLPGGGREREKLNDGNLGSWRAHVNAIQQAVYSNASSILILEDDIDWDVRLKQQLYSFAQSSHALLRLICSSLISQNEGHHLEEELDFDQLPQNLPPETSPYGDDWDLLWLGHCGMKFPPAAAEHIHKSRVIHFDDDTVAEQHYLVTWNPADQFNDLATYPQHTRAIHHVSGGVCSLGYALSRSGARKLLYFVGLQEPHAPFDILMSLFCDSHVCLTIQPPLFDHHRPAGPMSSRSDISRHGDGFSEQA